MFEVTPDEIAELNDSDLRTLVGLLCEAELERQGLSPAAVTYGGNQNAADGGLDVRIALPEGAAVNGFVPRHSTGVQVKKPDMPRGEILEEMRPGGQIRPVIQELANEAGAYIIVSSSGSTADIALRNRRAAMREALVDIDNPGLLVTDFYDRTRLATWVRRHPGYVAWVKEKIGKAFSGWRPYGPWSGGAEGINARYLLDDRLRIHLRQRIDPQPILGAINELRSILAQPSNVVRLVGLSGVGKTRLVQALFDDRVGKHPLSPALAVYTNMNDDPDPQPTKLVSDLIAKQAPAVLIIDNCTPDLHRRLTALCKVEASTVSLLTVEYDVGDDQPEGTEVVRLETCSTELIETLVRRQYPRLSGVDARTIAEASGGNFRIAIALSETVGPKETISGLSNEELFDRLFRQRRDPNDALLHAAQICSLFYSFQGEALSGEDAELPQLASLAGQTPIEIFRHVGELLRRDLVQRRGVWTAILPHAIANRLAARALENLPYDFVHQEILDGGNERLARSFSRRLMFLHDHPQAVAVVERWLAPQGLLGEVAPLNETKQAMLENVAPVLPERALEALERVADEEPVEAPKVWRRHMGLLRSLAYDPDLFERSARLLEAAALDNLKNCFPMRAANPFISLFTISFSGTHATIEQRLKVAARLLRSAEKLHNSLGIEALAAILRTSHYSSGQRYEFGSRSRDFGYHPRNREEVLRWYRSAFELIERLSQKDDDLTRRLRVMLGRYFRGLWTSAQMHDDLASVARKLSAAGFWLEGWIACRQTLRFDRHRLSAESATLLSTLETELSPSSLIERVQAIVLDNTIGDVGLVGGDRNGDIFGTAESLDTISQELGVAVANDDEAFEELLKDIFLSGDRTRSFGVGLAEGSKDLRATWDTLVKGLQEVPREKLKKDVLKGFVAGAREQDQHFARQLLDEVLESPALVEFFPALQAAIELDERGLERLKQIVKLDRVPVPTLSSLAYGLAFNKLSDADLKDLIYLIKDKPHGFKVALDILFMRLCTHELNVVEQSQHIIEAGQELMKCATFENWGSECQDRSSEIIKVCAIGAEAGTFIATIAGRLRHWLAAEDTGYFLPIVLLTTLIEAEPNAVLNALFSGEEKDREIGVRMFNAITNDDSNPADAIPRDVLLSWCEEDPDLRYPISASIITFAFRSEKTGAMLWTDLAKSLISASPDPEEVLAKFVSRFSPSSWSQSGVADMESTIQLLDRLEPLVSFRLLPLVVETKAKIVERIKKERKWETERNWKTFEQFE
ncbi:hypothetical protein [Roseibium aggregatum]|uniref:hypothetical protein n=1 Tax=Roseibium aggregatum TaxID=187304 RepID=UPI001E3B2D4B|nr:hypothetical protein [Roseibium aggregatum]UES43658.1 hypothetical protein GFK90_07650 [Roseibium aggregatum]